MFIVLNRLCQTIVPPAHHQCEFYFICECLWYLMPINYHKRTPSSWVNASWTETASYFASYDFPLDNKHCGIIVDGQIDSQTESIRDYCYGRQCSYMWSNARNIVLLRRQQHLKWDYFSSSNLSWTAKDNYSATGGQVHIFSLHRGSTARLFALGSRYDLHLFRRKFKKLKVKLKKCQWEMHVNFLKLAFNFLKLRLKRWSKYGEIPVAKSSGTQPGQLAPPGRRSCSREGMNLT